MNATKDEIIKAAELANAKDFIERLPDDYNTELTEDGNNLSIGQKTIIKYSKSILKPTFNINS